MPNRTSPRHPDFDYRTPAAYFVTVCAHDRRCLFGTVRRGRMRLNDVGLIVSEEWRRSETMREEVVLDAFVVMPNHLHGIICLVPPDVDDVSPRGYDLTVGPNPKTAETTTDDDVGTHGDVPESAPNDDVGTTGGRVKRGHAASVRVVPTFTGGSKTRGPALPSLSAVLAGFKSVATKHVNQHRDTPGAPVWQSRYYDRILRNEREWRACQRYVEQNPARWYRDRNHPARRSE
jgi:putative transposase